jgi:hypothetical protein
MKKQNLTSLKLNKKSISTFQIHSISGGKITWANAECASLVLGCRSVLIHCPGRN